MLVDTLFDCSDESASGVAALTSVEAPQASSQRSAGPATSLPACNAVACAWACVTGFRESAAGLSHNAIASDIANRGGLTQQCALSIKIENDPEVCAPTLSLFQFEY